jgi:chromosome condensin MukBEF MukE localization factor
MTDKELWEKSQVWESSDDGRGKLKILESVEKFAALVRADERDRATRENAYVLAEREACAFDAEWCIQNHLEHLIAERIRARGNT